MESTPAGSRKVEPLRTSAGANRWSIPLVSGTVGTSLLMVAYLLLSPDLPESIVASTGVGGIPWAFSTLAFLVLGVALGAAFTALFTGLTRAISSPHVLVHEYGGALWYSVLGAGVSVTLGILPFAWIATLAQAADRWPSGWPTALDLLPVLIGSPIVLFVVLPLAWMTLRGGAEAEGAEATEPSGGQFTFRCSSCGETFSLERIPVRTPQMGLRKIPGKASYRMTCPRCGDRGWAQLIGIGVSLPTGGPER